MKDGKTKWPWLRYPPSDDSVCCANCIAIFNLISETTPELLKCMNLDIGKAQWAISGGYLMVNNSETHRSATEKAEMFLLTAPEKTIQ